MFILVTGAAGFIGFHLCKQLLLNGFNLIGIDNLNDYYDINLKKARLNELKKISKNKKNVWEFIEGSLEDSYFIKSIFEKFEPKKVVNLAAQAGVRYSIENPSAYIQSNIVGFSNILESSRKNKIENLIYASSSSVYGGNTNFPFSESQSVDHPVSLYAATKKSNELMAHCYSHLYDLPVTGLRFFTVYGPWGRPDMALFLFTKAILENKPIKVFNHGEMTRDFTYIDDVVESLTRLLNKPAEKDDKFDSKYPDPSRSWARHRIFNIGNSNPVNLMDYISEIENNLHKKASKIYLPLQPGDVPYTSSDSSQLESWIGYKPKTTVKSGVKSFVKWYLDFYEIDKL